MSQFLNNTDSYREESRAGIDFDDAVKLPGGGSTCDIYKTRWQRREVFVKRLKEEFRSMPIYLDALDKEYEVGVGLRHPSLPDYREFHRDYIVMDYVDGMTLAEMMRRRDPWLDSEEHLVKMLRELVGVVDYLHRHNVVHCDIKPDNIIITSNTKNLVLLDFDKSYTYSLNDTSGHPGKYGLTVEATGKTAIDFHGIGMVVERLRSANPAFRFSGYERFVEACRREDVNCEDLYEILDHGGRSRKRWIPVAVAVLLTCVVAGYLFWNVDDADPVLTDEIADIALPVNNDTVVLHRVDTVWQVAEKQPEHQPSTSVAIKNVTPEPEAEAKDEHQEITLEEATHRAALLDDQIRDSFKDLLADLDRLNDVKRDTTLTASQLLDEIRAHSDIADDRIAGAFRTLNNMFPGLTYREQWNIIAQSKVYTSYTHRASPELKEYGSEIERRLKQEHERKRRGVSSENLH